MKKIAVFLLATVLFAAFSVTAFAVEQPYDSSFVPEIPDWITVYNDGNSIQYHGKNELDSGMPQKVFSDIFATEGPYVVLLSQGAYNKYNEENDIDYDREYQIYYLKLKNQNSSSEFEFGSFSHHGGPRHSELMTTGNTMLFQPLFNEFQCIKASYDRDLDRLVWDASPVTISHTAIHFTYVLGAGDPIKTSIYSSPLSGEHELYPYIDRIGGLTMEIGTDYNYAADSPYGEDYCERDYDWWVGIDGDDLPPVKPPYNPDEDLNKDINRDGKPDINIDSDGDGKADTNVDTDGDGIPDVNIKPGHGSGTGGSGTPDSWWETDGNGSDSDLTYNAWEFFNPFKFMYTPFEWDNDYNPASDYELPTMPDFPGCGIPDVSIKDPFDIPNDIHFKDYVIEFGGK